MYSQSLRSVPLLLLVPGNKTMSVFYCETENNYNNEELMCKRGDGNTFAT